MGGIFISYRREDSGGYAGRLRDALSHHFGANQVFRDVDRIAPGERFPRVIEREVGSCQALLAVIGSRWLSIEDDAGRRRLDDPDDYVRLEIAAALGRGTDVLVIPVLVGPTSMPAAADLPNPLASLAECNAVRLSDETWEDQVARLTRELDKVVRRSVQHGSSEPRKLSRQRAVIGLQSGRCDVGPLTLSAALKDSTVPIAGYPTGPAGPHIRFDAYNPDPVEFVLRAVEIELLDFRQLALDHLVHGVGATRTMRQYRAHIDKTVGRYQSTYVGGAEAAEYVVVAPEETEMFDVELTTTTEGLYTVGIHLVCNVNGQSVDEMLGMRPLDIAFFDRKFNYYVVRSDNRKMPYSQYIAEMAARNKDLEIY